MLRRVRKQVIDKMVGGGIPLPYESDFTPMKRTFPVEERNKIAEQVQEMRAEQALSEKDQNILGAKEMDTCFMDSSGKKYQPLKRKMVGKGMTGGAVTGGAMTGGAMTGGAMTGGLYGRVLGGAKCSCMEGSGVTGGATCGGAKKRGRPMKMTMARKVEDELIGSGFWSDFADGFMSVVRPVAGVAKAIAPSPVGSVLSAIGLGKKKAGKQSRKSKEDEKLAMEVKGIKDKLGLTKGGSGRGERIPVTEGKKRKVSEKYDIVVEPVVGDQRPLFTKKGIKTFLKGIDRVGEKTRITKGGAVTGGKKSRAQIVKEVMKKHGLKMIEASKYVKEHGLY